MLRVHRVECYFPKKKKAKYHPVKKRVYGTNRQCYLPRKGKTENHSLKNSVKDTLGTGLFSQEGVGLEINQLKLVLMVPGCNAIFRRNIKTKNQPAIHD